jgi:hypothetical protein
MSEPFFPQAFGTMPTIVGRETHAKEVTQLAVEIGLFGLRPSQGAHAQISPAFEMFGKNAQGGTYAQAGITDAEGKAALADLLFDAPAKA